MSLIMPEPDHAVMARSAEIAAALRRIVPGMRVIDHPDELRPYECDGLTAYRQPPMLVVLPETTAQVSLILAWCEAERVKVVPRGSGTSLSGGALPLADCVLLSMAKFNRILSVDYEDRLEGSDRSVRFDRAESLFMPSTVFALAVHRLPVSVPFLIFALIQ